jgi:hypothetical protein
VRMDPRGPAGLIQALSRLANTTCVDDLCADAAEERGEKWASGQASTAPSSADHKEARKKPRVFGEAQTRDRPGLALSFYREKNKMILDDQPST